MIGGLNHITFAVRNLEISFDFYRKVLGFKPVVKWDAGAYFDVRGLWFCLSEDPKFQNQFGLGYTHTAFSVEVDKLLTIQKKCEEYGVKKWKENSSEGDSFYFKDPDGHKLELHVGSLETRLEHYRNKPLKGMKFF